MRQKKLKTIYLRSVYYPYWTKIAYDEDTKYWIFNDSCKPVGLTCEEKASWKQINKASYTKLNER